MQLFNHTYPQWKSLPRQGDARTGERIWHGIEQHMKHTRRRAYFLWVAAGTAVAAACLTLGIFIGHHHMPDSMPHLSQYTWVIADNGAQLLPDGTRVWMESGSKLRYSDDFGSDRQVELEGNASFEVTHMENAARFIVNLHGAAVEVYGTSFSVKQDEESRVLVSLYEGKVKFTDTHTREHVYLSPGDQLAFSTGTHSMEILPFFAHAQWQSGRFKLEDMPLREVIQFIRWKYGTEISLASNVRDEGQRMTGIIGYNESLESVIDKICYVLQLNYRLDGQNYQLYK